MVDIYKHIPAADKELLAQSTPYAALSWDVYRLELNQPPEGWKVIGVARGRGADVKGLCACFYERTDGGVPRYAVAFRGTNKLRDMNNFGADARIMLLKLPLQHDRGVKFVQDICRENNINPADVAYTGHSLGGYLADTIGTSFNSNNIWRFNAPAPDARTRRNIERNKSPVQATLFGPGSVHIRSEDDMVSKWGHAPDQSKTITVKTVRPAHRLETLRGAVRRIINNEPPLAQTPRASGLLSPIFNSSAFIKASHALATQKVVSLAISFIMAIGPGHEPKYRLSEPAHSPSPLSPSNRKPVQGLTPRLV